MPRPAPVTTATRPAKRKLNRSDGDGGFEAQEIAEGAAQDRGPLVGGDTGEQLADQLSATPERALGVWVVVAPHDRRHASDVPTGDGDRVVLELHVELALHVLARLQRVRPPPAETEELGPVGLTTGR